MRLHLVLLGQFVDEAGIEGVGKIRDRRNLLVLQQQVRITAPLP